MRDTVLMDESPAIEAGDGGDAAIKVRRLLVIHNPTAGGRRARRLRAVVSRLEARGIGVTVRPTGKRGDAEEFAGAADPANVDAVVAAGGDGTINEVINGLAVHADAGRPLPLGIVPMGTANVLAAELGLTTDAGRIAAAIAGGRQTAIWPALANGRVFSLMAGVGLDARVVERVDPRVKRLIGKGAYVAETLVQLATRPDHRYRVTLDNGEPQEVASVIVAKGHFYGGRFICAPDARLTEPDLHVCLFPRGGRLNTLRYVWGVTAGRLAHFPDYRVVTAKRVRIEGPAGDGLFADAVQGDGDVLARLPVEITLAGWRLPVLAG
ncbi:lipid kinase [Azospirillum sp. TSH100]|uniref:diacylglycerol/lipid kinase family protein n=1 Tax=Azospirillum sp. TSH100 TaxID=652764 RepID=UPI000D622D15|nr:diacylglycerol kinase family protein [Azospirillum sp. TSH100]PWC84053.1 lipid kinase [Azospirillum sp. TSH100]QCG87520.1 diacylglycerol kinase family lipid kinase [Azospirillum sp. TSH100]